MRRDETTSGNDMNHDTKTATRKCSTYVEIHSGLLMCECGEETFLGSTESGGGLVGPLVANPNNQCPKCKKVWETLGNVYCDPGCEPDEIAEEAKMAGELADHIDDFLEKAKSHEDLIVEEAEAHEDLVEMIELSAKYNRQMAKMADEVALSANRDPHAQHALLFTAAAVAADEYLAAVRAEVPR